jgi:endoglucanase
LLGIGLPDEVHAMNAALLTLLLAALGPAHDFNASLGRGINLGNALEAPSEGAWGLRLREEFFPLIKNAGFQSVRIPIRWSAHAADEAPYAIDPAFLARVDWAVDQALAHGLKVVINVHHYEELYKNLGSETPRFLDLWRQVASHFRARPVSEVAFEVLNEPHEQLDADRWNALIPEALRLIRATNPERVVIIGPAQWNNLSHLDRLALPDDDRRLIVTFHYYSPFQFTHQGASWTPGSDAWLGRTWTGTGEQLDALRADFDKVAAWAIAHDRPIYLGEFGAYSRAPMESRAAWTRAVAREAEARGFSWAYWEFASGFGAYDPQRGQWRQPLLEALIPDAPL